jgi:hypothetical protein
MGFGGITSGTWFAPLSPRKSPGVSDETTWYSPGSKRRSGTPVSLLNSGIGTGANWNAHDVFSREGLGIFSVSSERIMADMKPFSIDAVNLRKRQTENATQAPIVNRKTNPFNLFG